jgi:hypothetical protein
MPGMVLGYYGVSGYSDMGVCGDQA